MIQTTKFDTVLVPLYRNTTLAVGERRGELSLLSQEILDALCAALQDQNRFGIHLHEPERGWQVGEVVQIELGDPRIGMGLIAETFEDVLKFPHGRSVCPKFFLLESKHAYSDDELRDSERYKRYTILLEWVKILSKAADFFDKEFDELVFLNGSKVNIPIIYGINELEKFDYSALESLLSKFSDEEQVQDHKLAILTESIIKQCSGVEPKRRFSSLLDHLPETLKSFNNGCRLYNAKFSYDKVRDELEVAKLDELARINKTFADVQSQILGIPVATVLVATQLKQTPDWGKDAWINTAVLAGVFIFVILAIFVMRNQRHTLSAISREIARKKESVEKNYGDIKDLVSDIFPELSKRLRLQSAALVTVQIILLGGLLCAATMYFVMTPLAWIWTKDLFTTIGTGISSFVSVTCRNC